MASKRWISSSNGMALTETCLHNIILLLMHSKQEYITSLIEICDEQVKGFHKTFYLSRKTRICASLTVMFGLISVYNYLFLDKGCF